MKVMLPKWLAGAATLAVLTSCGEDIDLGLDPKPTPTPSAQPSPLVSPSATPTPVSSPSSVPSPSPSPSPSPTPSVLPSASPAPTQTPTPAPSVSPSPTPTPSMSPSSQPQPIPLGTVSVDLNIQQYFGEVSQLQRNKFLNVHTALDSGMSRETVVWMQDHYNIDHGRQFWGPFSQKIVKNTLDASNEYPTEQNAIDSGKYGIDSYASSAIAPLVSNRKVVTEKPNNLMYKEQPAVDGANWAANYFSHYFTDESRPVFYEPMNEPFVHAGEFISGTLTDEAKVREYMINWYAEIGKAFNDPARPELADVNIIGYASAWPSMEFSNFSHWNSRMKAFIDGAGEHVDSFSTHLYDGVNIEGVPSERSGSNMQAILDLVETYSMKRLGEVKPHSITEYGTIVDRPEGVVEYDEAVNSQTIKSFNFIMMELMQREDRILTSIPFITGYAKFHWANPANGNGHPYNPSMWRPDLDKIRLDDKNTTDTTDDRWVFIDPNDKDNYVLTKNALFLEFWRDVRGHRAAVTNPDPDVATAVFVDNDKAFIVLSNLEHDQKEVTLKLAELADYHFSNIKIERLTVPSDVGANLATTNTPFSEAVSGEALEFESVMLAAGEAIKYTLTFDKSIQASQAKQRLSYYSDDYLKPIKANTAINFAINGVDTSNADAASSTAMLRMSIGRNVTASKQPILMVNNTEVAIPNDWAGYDQASRGVFFGAIDIPVPVELISESNQITLTFPDAGGHVSSLILEVNKLASGLPVSSVRLADDIKLPVGGFARLQAEVLPANAMNPSVIWSSADTNVATVNQWGKVTAVAAGTTTIRAETPNGKFDELTVSVADNLLFGANLDFEEASKAVALYPRNENGQKNAAQVFEPRANIGLDNSRGYYIDNTAGSLKLMLPASTYGASIDESKRYSFSFQAKVVSGKHSFYTYTASANWVMRGFTDSAEWQEISVEISGADLLQGAGIVFHLDPQNVGGQLQGGVVHIDNLSLLPVL